MRLFHPPWSKPCRYLLLALSYLLSGREARLYRSYSLLIKHVPLVKTLDESGNDIALDGLCANVSKY